MIITRKAQKIPEIGQLLKLIVDSFEVITIDNYFGWLKSCDCDKTIFLPHKFTPGN